MSDEKKSIVDRAALLIFFHNVLKRMKKLYSSKYGRMFIQQLLGEAMCSQSEIDCTEIAANLKVAETADIAMKYLDIIVDKNYDVLKVFHTVWCKFFRSDQVQLDL